MCKAQTKPRYEINENTKMAEKNSMRRATIARRIPIFMGISARSNETCVKLLPLRLLSELPQSSFSLDYFTVQ